MTFFFSCLVLLFGVGVCVSDPLLSLTYHTDPLCLKPCNNCLWDNHLTVVADGETCRYDNNSSTAVRGKCNHGVSSVDEFSHLNCDDHARAIHVVSQAESACVQRRKGPPGTWYRIEGCSLGQQSGVSGSVNILWFDDTACQVLQTDLMHQYSGDSFVGIPQPDIVMDQAMIPCRMYSQYWYQLFTTTNQLPASRFVHFNFFGTLNCSADPNPFKFMLQFELPSSGGLCYPPPSDVGAPPSIWFGGLDIHRLELFVNT